MSTQVAVLAARLGMWVAWAQEPELYPLPSPPEGKAHREHREKLELVASFSFFGNVMSMASVQLAGAKRDALLLSFKDAKVGGGLERGAGVDILVGGGQGGGGRRGSHLPSPAVSGGVRPGHP